jgi:ATP-dependent protease ClpP protease subunit
MTVDLNKLVALAETAKTLVRQRPEPQAKAWYNITNLSPDTTEVFIYEDIGVWGITASDFVAAWEGITSANIKLRLNSRGGDIFDGAAIYNAVKRKSKAGGGSSYVTSVVDGVAGSAASYIMLGADRVEMEKTSRAMIHDGGSAFYAEGSLGDMRQAHEELGKLIDILDDLSNMIAQVYVDKAGGTVASWRSLMSTDKWYSAEEAVEAGLADGLVGSTDTENKVTTQVTASTELPTTWDVEGLVNALKGAFA